MISLRLLNLLLVAVLTGASLLSCGGKKDTKTVEAVEADSLIEAAHKNHEYQRLLELADELQQSDRITDVQADYWRGYSYSRQRMMRLAEKYWKQAVSAEIRNDEELTYYAKSANRLSASLLLKGEYEATMEVAVPAIETMTKANYQNNSDYAYLLTTIGCCQLKFGSLAEATHNFQQAYVMFGNVLRDNPSRENFTTAIVGVITITENYLQQKCFQEAYDWTLKFRDLLNYYQNRPNPDAAFLDKQLTRLNIYHASALEGLGNHSDAKQTYSEALKSNYIQTNEGKLEAINYLMSAGRWDEAADNFEVLDKQFQQYDISDYSMDIIQHYLLPKFRANVGARRDEAANAVGRSICNRLDSAIILMQKDAAMELAILYNTQQKEKEITEQKAKMAFQHYLATVITLVLVLLCFVLIIYFRHQAAMRLEKAYGKLEIANERTMESSRMKTSFIRQMSHEIRTPLNILSGFTQIITTPGMELTEETRKDINEKIIENTNRITELVNKMLELSDVSSKTVIERTDMLKATQIALEAVSTASADKRCHIPIDLQLADGIDEVSLQTNGQVATRALCLLLDNAERFTKEGSVTLRVDRKHDMVQYIVEDTGIGIPAGEAEHVFQEFVQLNEYEEGTGIGLTVARSICRRLGGNVVLDTSYTSGARFVMTLPVKA